MDAVLSLPAPAGRKGASGNKVKTTFDDYLPGGFTQEQVEAMCIEAVKSVLRIKEKLQSTSERFKPPKSSVAITSVSGASPRKGKGDNPSPSLCISVQGDVSGLTGSAKATSTPPGQESEPDAVEQAN
ncbi:hypothetical protein PQX77_018921 [Marasmius sp. AFHP31]|nr:hypothetical protein PQX77_018921 [Marasmius sp. AFHP31]